MFNEYSINFIKYDFIWTNEFFAAKKPVFTSEEIDLLDKVAKVTNAYVPKQAQVKNTLPTQQQVTIFYKLNGLSLDEIKDMCEKEQ